MPMTKCSQDREKSKALSQVYIPEKKITRIVTWGGLTAAIAPVAAIWSLHHTTNLVKKLAAVTGWVVGFAATIGLFTSAERKEVFTATAAYGAVLVIYVAVPPHEGRPGG